MWRIGRASDCHAARTGDHQRGGMWRIGRTSDCHVAWTGEHQRGGCGALVERLTVTWRGLETTREGDVAHW